MHPCCRTETARGESRVIWENLVILLFILLLSAHKQRATQLLNLICNEASRTCLHNLDLTGVLGPLTL